MQRNASLKIDLRKQFVEGEISAQEVEIKDHITAAEGNLHSAQSRVSFLKEQMIRLKNLENRGLVLEQEIKQLE